MLAQQFMNGLVIGSVYALFSLGFTLVFGVQNILNFAHGAVFTCGAFVGFYAITTLQVSLPMAFLLAIVAGGILSVLLDLTVFRPLRRRKAPEFAPMVGSIGASLILISIVQELSQAQVFGFPPNVFPATGIVIAGIRISFLQITVFACVAAICGSLLFYLYRTNFGLRIRAVAISERTAMRLGIDPGWVYLQTFFISGAIAGAAGIIIGVAFNSVHFLMGESLLLRCFVVVVLGGLGSITGSLVAGLILGVIQAITVAYLSSQLSDAIIFGMLLILLLVRPTGLFKGLRQEVRVARR